MSNRRRSNKKLIGLFAIAGVLLFVIFLGILLSDKILVKKDNLFVLYFDEPVRNLSIGSPVMFSGVEIGKVAKIDLLMDKKDLSFSIPVYININFNEIFKTSDQTKIEDKNLFIKKLIEKGLKGKLNTHSIITGQLMIELELRPDIELREHKNILKDNPDIVEIPSMLSSKGQLTKGLQDLPIKEIIEKIDSLLASVNRHLPLILSNSSEFVDKVNEYGDETNGLVDLIKNANRTINNIGDAAKSLHNFLDYLERNPESLLKGKSNY